MPAPQETTLQAFDAAAARSAFAAHPDWTLNPEKGCARRLFMFEDFAQAFGFMAQMAIVSEAMKHHPEWFNVYNRVDITLTTHDAGGLSPRDKDWAERADKVYAAMRTGA